MEVSSEDKASRLGIEVINNVFVEYPSLMLSITIADEGFCRAYSSAWVALSQYEAFVADLSRCERARQGEARFAGFSPGELEIAVESSDSLGHFSLSYRLGRTSYTPRGVQNKTVTGDFDLDVEYFAQIVSDFAGLLPASGI